MANESVKTMDADKLHQVGQNATVGSAFVTPGIPDAALVGIKDVTDPQISADKTAKLRSALENINKS